MSDLPQTLQGATPQFYSGNEIGCLVIHGFMASPAEVGWLGQYLAEQGYTVSVPRLTGHGIDPTYMPRLRWQDWYAHVVDNYQVLKQQCEKVVVVGHSMGGLLSILLASKYDVDALVVAAAPMSIPTPLMPYTRYVSWVMPFRNFPSEKKLIDLICVEQEQRDEPVIGRVNYSRWSLRAVYELYRLIRLAPTRLPSITAPTLLLYAAGDTTVPISDRDLLQHKLQAEVVQIHTLKDGNHIIFQDSGREAAFSVVADFIAQQIN